MAVLLVSVMMYYDWFLAEVLRWSVVFTDVLSAVPFAVICSFVFFMIRILTAYPLEDNR